MPLSPARLSTTTAAVGGGVDNKSQRDTGDGSVVGGDDRSTCKNDYLVHTQQSLEAMRLTGRLRDSTGLADLFAESCNVGGGSSPTIKDQRKLKKWRPKPNIDVTRPPKSIVIPMEKSNDHLHEQPTAVEDLKSLNTEQTLPSCTSNGVLTATHGISLEPLKKLAAESNPASRRRLRRKSPHGLSQSDHGISTRRLRRTNSPVGLSSVSDHAISPRRPRRTTGTRHYGLSPHSDHGLSDRTGTKSSYQIQTLLQQRSIRKGSRAGISNTAKSDEQVRSGDTERKKRSNSLSNRKESTRRRARSLDDVRSSKSEARRNRIREESHLSHRYASGLSFNSSRQTTERRRPRSIPRELASRRRSSSSKSLDNKISRRRQGSTSRSKHDDDDSKKRHTDFEIDKIQDADGEKHLSSFMSGKGQDFYSEKSLSIFDSDRDHEAVSKERPCIYTGFRRSQKIYSEKRPSSFDGYKVRNGNNALARRQQRQETRMIIYNDVGTVLKRCEDDCDQNIS